MHGIFDRGPPGGSTGIGNARTTELSEPVARMRDAPSRSTSSMRTTLWSGT